MQLANCTLLKINNPMTQNNIINQIVEVLHKHSKFAAEKNGKAQLYVDDVKAAATEIAALQPLTKLREEVERLKHEVIEDAKLDSSTKATIFANGLEIAYERVLSLLTQENDGNASEIFHLLSDLIKWEETNFIEPDLLARVKDAKAKLERPLPSPPKSK